mmetsp:Transcript_99520/g.310065  ORF Transcript_99520/g.310065 Transcript_99520/m.310065 type:complete len:248 (-) Transcript_99520:274-1017(-)
MASQFVKMPRKKPVSGSSTTRAVPCNSRQAASCTQPQMKPRAAPQCSMKRNSRSPILRKKLLRSALFSVKIFTTMPSLSMPMRGSQSRSVNSRQRSGQDSSICSRAAMTISCRTAAGNFSSHNSRKCCRATESSVLRMILSSCGRVFATMSRGSTLSNHWRGPKRYFLAHWNAVRAIFCAFRGTTPCQPKPRPVSPIWQQPKNFKGKNIIWIASQMWNHVKNNATTGMEASMAISFASLRFPGGIRP